MNYVFLMHINLEQIPAYSRDSGIVAKYMVLDWWDVCFVLIWGTKIYIFNIRNRFVPCNEICSWLPL